MWQKTAFKSEAEWRKTHLCTYNQEQARNGMPMTDSLKIEQRSLNVAKWANLFMAACGIGAGILANADALLLDGLFSGLNFLTAVGAGYVATSVRRAPDKTRPFGYEIDESVFVMFRSLLLLGVLLMALFTSLNRIVAYWLTGEAAPIALGWIMVYTGLMAVVCFGLWAFHRLSWRKSGRNSDLLRVEGKSALIDGLLSAGAGAAFLGIAQLKGGPLEVFVPISDALIVLVLCAALLPQPVGIFRGALRDILGVSLPDADSKAITEQARIICEGSAFEVLSVASVRTGRSLFHLVYLKPEAVISVSEFELIRSKLSAAAAPDRVEATLASSLPYEPA